MIHRKDIGISNNKKMSTGHFQMDQDVFSFVIVRHKYGWQRVDRQSNTDLNRAAECGRVREIE